MSIPRKIPQHGLTTGTLTNTGDLRSPAMPLYHGDAYGENRRLAARVAYPSVGGDQIPTSNRFALKVYSRTDEDANLFAGIAPYGNLWDALVSGDLTVVTIDGRLTDPTDPDDTGWLEMTDGDNLYLYCTLTDGDIDSATLEVGSSSALCEFSGYVQTAFRVVLAYAQTIDTQVVVIPMHEGELVANFEIINSKLAKYAR